MCQYNFSTLNDKDLEVLVRDLLTKEFSIPFQSFKLGKDKGIDLRYSTTDSENQIIVQVKHYLKSGYNQLLRVLKNEEKKKIDKLLPKRYILVTSIGLSPTDKETIKKTLSPYVLNTNDIFGADDLNSLITKHNDIEKRHFKLWFSNTNIIQKIVNNGIDGRSAFIEEKIKKNTGIYVVNKSYDEALEILRKQKVLLIAGIPGIGKTSLANLITYHLLSRDFRLVYIDEKIREAEDMFDNDTDVKQLFYFDDFLGSNYLEIINSKNTEKSIVNFIERIRTTKNKYLILTTRSTILNQARNSHEKLSRANLDSLKYEIEIKNYSNYDKARILYNHLFFNDINEIRVKELFANKNYWQIINHNNYNPRLIEYFTNESNISHLKEGKYFDFIISNLNNPEEIWESALINQLNASEKYLLFSLLSFGRFVSKTDLEMGFEAKIEYEVLKHGFTREINIFNISLRNLLDGYITNTIAHHTSNNSYIDFINPSLRDYLISFFNKNNLEKWKLIESFVFVEQFMTVFRSREKTKNNIVIEDIEVQKFVEIACSKNLQSTIFPNSMNIKIRLSGMMFSYRTSETQTFIDRLILSQLKDVDWENLYFSLNEDILPIIENIDDNSDIFNYFKDNWDLIVEKLIKNTNDDIELHRINKLFEKYNFDYQSYRKSDGNWIDLLKTVINRVFKREADSIWERNEAEIYCEDDCKKIGQEISEKFEELVSNYFFTDDKIKIEQEYNPIENIDVNYLIEENNKTITEEDIRIEDVSFERDLADESREKIDDLFSIMEK